MNKTITPEVFAQLAQELYDKMSGSAGEEGHIEMDALISDVLCSIDPAYKKGLDILYSMNSIWYA